MKAVGRCEGATTRGQTQENALARGPKRKSMCAPAIAFYILYLPYIMRNRRYYGDNSLWSPFRGAPRHRMEAMPGAPLQFWLTGWSRQAARLGR